MKKIIVILLLSFTSNLMAQTAPKGGKKVLAVKENHKGEYMQKVIQGDLSSAVIDALKKRVPEKLKKYGFNNITITDVGKVLTPVSTATKMSNLVGGNKGAGEAQLTVAKTTSEINNAVKTIYQEDKDIDWKFQVNFIDNETKEEFKVRLSLLSYSPKYIIKKSNEVVNLRD